MYGCVSEGSVGGGGGGGGGGVKERERERKRERERERERDCVDRLFCGVFYIPGLLFNISY